MGVSENGLSKASKRTIQGSGLSYYALVTGILLLLMSVSLNVVLARRVQGLERFQSRTTSDRLLEVGTSVPSISVNRLDGERDVISYNSTSQTTVLYIFTPLCSWCTRNLDNFKLLVDKAGRQYHFVGLSLSEKGLARYVTDNDLELPIYFGASEETKEVYKMWATPQTIVISPDGRVLQSWAGAYTGKQKAQVEAFFHVVLPGLRELSKNQRD